MVIIFRRPVRTSTASVHAVESTDLKLQTSDSLLLALFSDICSVLKDHQDLPRRRPARRLQLLNKHLSVVLHSGSTTTSSNVHHDVSWSVACLYYSKLLRITTMVKYYKSSQSSNTERWPADSAVVGNHLVDYPSIPVLHAEHQAGQHRSLFHLWYRGGRSTTGPLSWQRNVLKSLSGRISLS